MGITDIYKNYKEKKAQKNQNGVQTAEQLWEDTQQKYNIACENAEELSSHLEQGIKSNAKISESELDMISQTAKDTFKEINEIKFNKMFPRYKQIEAMVIRYSMFKGMGSEDAITKIIEEGKTREPMFDADDILLPYLLEKKNLDILNTREKDILDKRFSDDLDTYNRLRMSYLLNCKYYTPDNFTTEDPFASFPATKDAFINFRFKYGTADEIKQRTAPVENASYSK